MLDDVNQLIESGYFELQDDLIILNGKYSIKDLEIAIKMLKENEMSKSQLYKRGRV